MMTIDSIRRAGTTALGATFALLPLLFMAHKTTPLLTSQTTGMHLMTHTAMIDAHRNEQPRKLRARIDDSIAHHTNNLTSFSTRLRA